jgi:hypothetical protein
MRSIKDKVLELLESITGLNVFEALIHKIGPEEIPAALIYYTKVYDHNKTGIRAMELRIGLYASIGEGEEIIDEVVKTVDDKIFAGGYGASEILTVDGVHSIMRISDDWQVPKLSSDQEEPVHIRGLSYKILFSDI